ncbi:MAG: FecR domain-containing protein [Pirellulaceae bacterium]
MNRWDEEGSDPDQAFWDAVLRYGRGEATAEDLQRITRAIRENSSRRDAMLDALAMDAMLREYHDCHQVDPTTSVDQKLLATSPEATLVPRSFQPNPSRSSWPGLVPWIATAAILAASLIFGWRWILPSDPQLTSQRTGSNANDADAAEKLDLLPSPPLQKVWVEILAATGQPPEDLQPWQHGDRFHLDRLDWRGDMAQVKLDSGVVLTLHGPTRASFESAMAMRLHEGQMTAEVSQDAQGFQVLTESTEVVDFGQRFGMRTDSSGQTDVVVLDGSLKIRPAKKNSNANRPPRNSTGRSNGSSPVHERTERWTQLQSGDAVRMQTRREGMERLARLRVSRDAKSWQLMTAEATDRIADVDDNMERDQTHRFYGVVPGGMEEGSRPFSDRPGVVLTAPSGQRFPECLEGTDLVKTFWTERGNRDFEIRLQLRQPSTIYLLVDQRRTQLDWLQRDFRDSGHRLHLTPLAQWRTIDNNSDRPPVVYEVWSRKVERAGVVVLGPPMQRGLKGGAPMYGIAVGPLDPFTQKVTSNQPTKPLFAQWPPPLAHLTTEPQR